MHHPIFDLVAGTSKILIVDDNAKSHAVKEVEKSVLDPRRGSPPCRWESSPVLSTRPKIVEGLKRSSSVPEVSIPSLRSLVSPVRRRSVDLRSEEDVPRPLASELLSEYLRMATENFTVLDLGNGEQDDYEDTATTTTATETVSSESITSVSSSETTPSLLSNVKKPIRRRSLDATQAQTAG
eukprot:scaffold2069_cov187-Amphora_coffeaeformis.AAC.22